jgi:hypothetical protein
MSLIWGVTALPPYRNLTPRFRTEGVYKRGTDASLRREKLWVLGAEELLGLPCSLLLGMMAPLNLVEANHPSHRDLVLLTQKFH